MLASPDRTAIPQLQRAGSPDPAQWPASLHLEFAGPEFAGKSAKTVLKRSRHQGPLYVQRAFYPEGPDCAHVYLLHPPGGVVSGDTLDITLEAKSRAKVLITTPGATRLYRARLDRPDTQPLTQIIRNQISVAEASFVEWLPAETIVFDGAHIDLQTEVNLDPNSQFCGWEIGCLGLPASNELFKSGSFKQSFNISVEGIPKVLDRLQFKADSAYLQSLCGFQGYPVYGSLIAGPFGDVIDESVDVLRHKIEDEAIEQHFAVTAVNQFIILRYLGSCSAEVREIFIDVWKAIRPMLVEREAIEPRIWAT